MKARKTISLGIAAIALILFQLMSPLQVRADGEPATPTEVPTEATAQPVDSAPTPDLLMPTDKTLVETSPLIPTHENGLQLDKRAAGLETPSLPADTNMVVLGNDGQPVPLASQQAAEAILTSDPIWCPAGQAPTPGANGCTIGYITLAELVRNESANILSNGTIWMTSGVTNEVPARLVTVGECLSDGRGNCTSLIAWSNYALTIQGGWSGMAGDASIGPNTVLVESVRIIGWNNDITINDLTISQPHPGWDCGNLCVLSSSGNIVLNNVDAQNDHNEISSVGVQTHSGNISVSNSDFVGNSWGGLWAMTLDGDITVTDSHFDHLFGDAAYLYSGRGNIFISNSSFDDNGGQGAFVRTVSGDIDILNSSFNNNRIGLQLSTIDPNSTTTISESSFINNDQGLWTPDCAGKLQLNNVDFSGNRIDIDSVGNLFTGCVVENPSVIVALDTNESNPDAPVTPRYSLILPNGDIVNVSDPANGAPQISPLASADLPVDLPEGFTYISAFSLDILQNGQAVPLLTDGGSIQISFRVPSLEPANNYSVLYWDNGIWVPLQNFVVDENGGIQAFDLDTGNPDDGRTILSGVRLVTTNNDPRVEVSTNFPGIFVLAQH